MTIEEVQDLMCNNEGICVSCGEVGQFAEPDARNYTCDACGENTVFGAEQAVVEMRVDVV
jgi:predicted RNA-binding Zn-ribbon protein involved in translation (DUF1610 family)